MYKFHNSYFVSFYFIFFVILGFLYFIHFVYFVSFVYFVFSIAYLSYGYTSRAGAIFLAFLHRVGHCYVRRRAGRASRSRIVKPSRPYRRCRPWSTRRFHHHATTTTPRRLRSLEPRQIDDEPSFPRTTSEARGGELCSECQDTSFYRVHMHVGHLFWLCFSNFAFCLGNAGGRLRTTACIHQIWRQC